MSKSLDYFINHEIRIPIKQPLGGGNSNIFGIFTPKIGEDFPFD